MHPTHASRRHARIVDGTLHQAAPDPRPESTTAEIRQRSHKLMCFLRRLLLSQQQPPRLAISNPSDPLRFDHATRTFCAVARRESVRMAAAPRTIQPGSLHPTCPGLSSHPVRRRSPPRAPPCSLPKVPALVASHATPSPHPPPTKPLPPCPGLSSHPVQRRAALPEVLTLITSAAASPPAITVSPPTPPSSPSPRHRLRPADAWEVEARQLRRKLTGSAETQRELQGVVERLHRQVRGLARENAGLRDRAAVERARTQLLGGSVRALARQFTESLGLVGKFRAEIGVLERTVGGLVGEGSAVLGRPGTATAAAGPCEQAATVTPVGGALVAPPADELAEAESQTSFGLSPPATPPSPSCQNVHDEDSDVEFKRLSQLSNTTSAPISAQSLPSCDISTPTIRPLNLVSRVRFKQLAEDDVFEALFDRHHPQRQLAEDDASEALFEALAEMDTWAWSSIPVLGLRDPRE